MLNEEPESADQDRRRYMIFFLSDRLASTDEQSVKDVPETVAWEELQQNPSKRTIALREMRSLCKRTWNVRSNMVYLWAFC